MGKRSSGRDHAAGYVPRKQPAPRLLAEIREQMEAIQALALPASALSKASRYNRTLWDRLTASRSSAILLSNNLAKHSMRPRSDRQKELDPSGQSGRRWAARSSKAVADAGSQCETLLPLYRLALPIPGCASLNVRPGRGQNKSSFRACQAAQSAISCYSAHRTFGQAMQKLFTDKQGQYLAFIYYYTKIQGCPPSESEMQQHFRVSPASVHQMVLSLEAHGLIQRTPGQPRSIRLLIPREQLPQLGLATYRRANPSGSVRMRQATSAA